MTAERPPTLIVRVRDIDGELMLDSQCMSLLFGVPLDAIQALPRTAGASPIPTEWIRRGRRRAKEARAHTHSDAMLESLRYWAEKDHGATLAVVHE